MAAQGATVISAMGCGTFLDFVAVLAGSCTHNKRSGNEGVPRDVKSSLQTAT